MQILHVVVSNQPQHPQLVRMRKDAAIQGWEGKFHVLGLDRPDMPIGKDRGFGMKLIALYEFLEKAPPGDVILFTDAHDVRVLGTPQTILDAFLAMKTRILISAEKNCYPHPEAAQMYDPALSKTPYKYVNSGAMMGYVKDLRSLLKEVIEDVQPAANDQAVMTGLFLKYQTHPEHVRLDTNCEIFQNTFLAGDDIDALMLGNKVTRTYPFVWHGNGNDAFWKRELSGI